MKRLRPIVADKLPGELKELIANVLDRDQVDLPFDANLIEAMDVDSVMRLEILVALERTYGVTILQDDLSRIGSLRDVCALLLEKAAAQAVA